MLTAFRPNFVDIDALWLLINRMRDGEKFRPVAVPKVVVADSILTGDALALFAYRFAQKKEPFHLHHKAARKHLGLSKAGYYVALGRLTDFGFIRRDVVAGRVRSEQVNPWVRSENGKASGEIVIPYDLFGIMSPSLISFYMFALTGYEARGLYPGEFAIRFRLSRETVLRRLGVLSNVGLFRSQQNRVKDGRYNGTSFHALRIVPLPKFRAPPDDDEDNAQMPETAQLPERQNPERENEPTYKATTASLQGSSTSDRHRHVSAEAETCETHASLASGRLERFSDGGALHWIDEEDRDDWGVALQDEDSLEQAAETLSNERIFDDIMRATQNRFGVKLRELPQLQGYLHLVAAVMHKQECNVLDAHNYLLGVIEEVIGDRPARWLNSWGYLGKSIQHRLADDGPEGHADMDEDWDDETDL